jgi:prophage regulatory protein
MSKRVNRLPTVKDRTGHSTSTIYQLMAEGLFPRPIKLGPRAVGWIEEEVDHYIEQRIAARDAEIETKNQRRTARASQMEAA